MPTMKKENVTITFESEQLAALEFSLKKKEHQRAGAIGRTAQMSLRIRGAGAGTGISRQPHSACCPSPPSGKAGEAADAGGASLCIGTACRRKGW